jgi:hypothetical protein
MNNKSSKFIHVASLACVIHCFLTPILIIFLPFLAHYSENHLIEFGLLGLSIVCGLFIIYKGYCTHKKGHGAILFVFGACLWITHSFFELHNIVGAKIYFLVGTLLVIASYLINHRLIKCCPKECNK